MDVERKRVEKERLLAVEREVSSHCVAMYIVVESCVHM